MENGPLELDKDQLTKFREKMEEYISKLPPKEQAKIKKKADKIAVKHYLRSGTPVICSRCKKGGASKETGSLTKMKDGSGNYMHQNCLVFKI